VEAVSIRSTFCHLPRQVKSGSTSKRTLRYSWPEGYVFNNVHNIQAEDPPENVISLFEAAYDYGFYE
jgi:hypothetical protein